jgi:hypothetical protein
MLTPIEMAKLGTNTSFKSVVITGRTSTSLSAATLVTARLGVAAYPWNAIDAGQTFEVVSTSASDTVGGVGAQSVIVKGLSSSLVEQSATVAMNSTTPVSLPGTWRRINSVEVDAAGSSLSNVGTVSVRIAGAGATVLGMVAGLGMSQDGIYTVPAGHTFVAHTMKVEAFLLASTTNQRVTAHLTVRTAVGKGFNALASQDASVTGTSTGILTFHNGIKIAGGSDIDLKVSASVASMATEVRLAGTLIKGLFPNVW